ncbi:MAG: hypothetical protein ACRDKE_11655, partial [Solirubrobacterales bacterium]
MSTPISRLHLCLLLTFTALALLVATGSAAAATTLGQNCTSTTGGPETAFQKSISGGASYTAPTDGVITHWGVNKVGTGNDSNSALIVGSETSPGTWTVRAMSPLVITTEFAITEQDVRIGIKAGEGIGFSNFNSGGALCSTPSASDTMVYS